MTRKKKIPYVSKETQIQKNVEKLDILAIDSLIKGLSVQRDIAIEKAMNSDDIVDIMKAQQYLDKNKAKSPELKSHIYLPEDFTYSGNSFKQPITGMPFEVLQRMGSVPVVNSIIKTRINQVKLFLTFSSDVNKAGYTIKRKSSIFEEESKKNLSPKDKQTIEYIVNYLENGGKGGKWDDGDDLHDFVSKILIDSLSMDQCAFELVRDRKGDLFKHVAIDGSLIRQLDSNDPRYAEQFEPLRVNGFLPKYAQVWNDQIVKTPNTNDSVIYYPWELGYGIRNKTSNVRTNGYGISELEVANEIVTYILWGFQYNGNFFKQGSNPKGFINIKNGNMNNSVLNEFRQSWRQMMSGVNNSHKLAVFEGVDLEWTDLHQCLHRDSEVFTKEGKKQLGQLLGDGQEIESEIWDGLQFKKARVFVTKEKQIFELTLNNRVSIKTSPDHRFLVLKNNEPTWVKREDIVLGDYIFVNKNSIENNQDKLFYNGVEVEEDLFELLGWITGDGHLGDDKNSKRIIRTFYHPTKELDVLDYHISICEKYGINVKKYIYKKSLETIAKQIELGKIKSAIGEYPILAILDAKFFNWVISLDFTPSRGGKNIPDFMYSFDSKLKCAFLRGFFSADGHVSEKGERVDITISNSNLKEQTIMLLMSEGIRCSSFKSKKSNCGFNPNAEDNVLLIKDRDLFFDKINFIQDYKKQRESVRQKTLYKVNEAPISFIKDLALKVKGYNKTLATDVKLDKKDLHDLLNISRGHQKASLSKVIHYANKINYKTPSWINEYNLEVAIELTETDEFVEMVDVEMFSEDHKFVANGMVVHNSNKDMEFQQWTEFLIVVFCSVFSIDPSELGFHFKDQADMFGQQGQKERLDHSQKKGLEPLLKFLEKLFNKYIVSEIDPEFEFKFTGISIEDENAKIELDKKKLDAGVVSQEDMFLKYSGRKCDPKKDTILNQTYQTAQNMKQQGGDVMNQVADEDEEGVDENNPFSQYEKSIESSPIMQESMKYFDQIFKK